MHEEALAERLAQELESLREENGAAEVVAVTVEIGGASECDVTVLRSAFDALRPLFPTLGRAHLELLAGDDAREELVLREVEMNFPDASGDQ